MWNKGRYVTMERNIKRFLATLLAAFFIIVQFPFLVNAIKYDNSKEKAVVFFDMDDVNVPSILKDYKIKVLDNNNDYNKIDYTVVYQPSILPVHSVNATIFDDDKNIWVGSDEGLLCLDLQSGIVKDYSSDEYLSHKKVDGLYLSQESSNYIWVLTGDTVTRIKYK